MNTFHGVLKKISDAVNYVAEKICIVLVGSTVVIILVSIVFRYIFMKGLPWPEELSRSLNIWITFLGGSIGFKYSDHVGVEFFTNLLPAKAATVVKFLTRLMTFYIILVIDYFCLRYTMTTSSTTAAMMLPYQFINSALFVGFTLMLIHLLYFIVSDVRDMSAARGGTI